MALARLLIVDDNPTNCRILSLQTGKWGMVARDAQSGQQALDWLRAGEQFDLAILDMQMPGMDGFEVCQRLRTDIRTKNISVIMLTARSLSADKVVGLTGGADDYIIKPFDPLELVARVKSALRRAREMRNVNPLTQLPGNVQVQEEVSQRTSGEKPFALMYIDLDNFKAFNDHYGFLRGDEAIKLLARCAREALKGSSRTDHFLGHVGGDDFVAVVGADAAEAAARDIIECWDREIVALYDPEDVDRGYIEVEDRRRQTRHFPITTVSVGIASSDGRSIDSHWVASEIASEMKNFAKRDPMSSYAIDRRRS